MTLGRSLTLRNTQFDVWTGIARGWDVHIPTVSVVRVVTVCLPSLALHFCTIQTGIRLLNGIREA